MASEIATILQTAIPGAPARERSRGVSAESRERSYVRFQQAAIDLALWASQLQALAGVTLPAQGLTGRVLAVTAAVLPSNWGLPIVNSKAIADLARARLLVDMIGDVQREQGTLRQAGAVRDALANFLGSLGEVRLGGATEPRKYAEQITALLGELFMKTPTRRPPKPLRGLPMLRIRDADWLRLRSEFDDCSRALGEAHRDFVLAARKDLGRGHGWWQFGKERTRRWQVWRPSQWPGGWPGPDPKQLVAESKARRALTLTQGPTEGD